ncbi:MAG TPA: acylphosphatase [Steroidobacteraceae bacterium]|nr:acylphosphatase [Steroidobacteraceae bacterium]
MGRDLNGKREARQHMIGKICWVSGRVQGVYYRGTALTRARELGVHGYAKNLGDGRVEVLVFGEEQAVQAFIEWLWIGSSASRVTSVEVADAPERDQPPFGFRTA